ncbi:hypothetical protein L596_013693 [Steinernema carpocapsae]|uniref:Ion transport domain-containing protein n=1 Tax=Steinernema carpocapsae TaxID=34508 RepID=A0A4U5P1L7_STECR|nr:hypothetical protein L596_013693 [Steinernema carpocapsae]
MPTKDHLEPHRRQSALSSHLRQNGYTRHDSYYYESRRQSVKIPENQNLEATKVGITAMGVRAMAQVPRMKSLNVRRKFYEFFSAPITTFWTWTLSFVVFMCCLSYSLLVRTPTYVSGVEWFLISYVMVLMIELIRKFMMSEPKTFRQKVIYFFSSFWNIETMAAIIVYLIGFGMRCKGWPAGRVILACDSVLWSIKLLDFMSIHPTLGPYITMAGKMVLKMCYIIALLVVTLLAFGLPRQSITYPNEEWHWLLIRNIFYKPYFMLYGEVYAPEIDTCGDDAWKNHLADGTDIDDSHQKICVPGHWVPPALMVFFMIVANLLLIAMLNATFTNIFEDTTKIAGHIWLFQRYRQVMEYEGTPFIPPPFTPIYYIWMTFKYLRLQKVGKKLGKNQRLFDFTLKLFLETAEVEKLHDFEEECMEDLAKDKDYKTNTSTEQRIHRAADRTDLLLVRVNDFAAKEQMLKNNIRDLESRVEKIEGMQNEVLDYVGQISNALPVILGALSQPQRPQSPYSSVGFNEEFERNGSIRITGPEGYDYVPNKEPLSPSYSNTLEPPMQVRQRHRTTTVNLGDVMATNLRTPNTLGHHGGSVLSLDPRSLSSRSTRDNDEYTSITDAIAASVRSKAKAKELQAKKTSQVEKDEYEAPPEITTNNVTMTTEDEEDDIDEMDLSEADEDEFLKAAGPRQRAASFFANRKS